MKNKVRTQFFPWILLAVLCLAPGLPAAQTQTKSGDITGQWHFVFQTQDGTREFDATFQQDGDKVTGKWATTGDVKGTFSGGKLLLEFPYNSDEAGPGTLKIDGNFANDAFTGTWSFQTYDGDFKATRLKAGVN